MTTLRQAFLARLVEAADSEDPHDVRHMVRSIYGALCFEGGLDKQAALTELAEHWDKVEALNRRQDNKLN